ncbi:MAG: hypothetical protein Q7R31_01765 [Candidatus Levybacteria bacterium]|nr:hypothetical protein [Candidatus Levybacteria bacterium]
MVNRELSPEKAEALWEKMDDLGYAGKLGSNKPVATQLIKEADQAQQTKQISPEILQDAQSELMPMSDLEKREADRQETANRLQPNGRYKSSRRKSGIKNPIDGSSVMNYIKKSRSYG